MSSLAATQADGYYLPSEYYESGAYKKQSKNQFYANQKNNGNNNTKIGHNQYLQRGVVRFELPYKGVCQQCKQSISRGTRYNAQKSTTEEKYFTTPIYEFTMKCHHCQNCWRIRTNPQQRGFDYVQGVTIQAGQISISAPPDSEQSTSVLDQLEKVAHGKRKTITEIEELQQIQKLNYAASYNDADNNAIIRKTFRQDRKEKRQRIAAATEIGWKHGMELLPTTAEDKLIANETVYGKATEEEIHRLRNVRRSSIFAKTSSKSKRTSRQRPRRRLERPSPVRSNLDRDSHHGTMASRIIPDNVDSTATKSFDDIIRKDDKDSKANDPSSSEPRKKRLQIIGSNGIKMAESVPEKSYNKSGLAALMAAYNSDDD